MDVSSVINGFNSYLEDLSEISGKTYNTSSSGISLFTYSNEFKNYLSDELNADASIFSKSISEILNMDIVNGKLVEAEEENSETSADNTEENDVSDETSDTATITDGSAETEGTATAAVIPDDGTTSITGENSAETTEAQEFTFTDVINALFEEDTVHDIADTDYDGELSESEIENFLNIVKEYDGNSEDVSLEDLLSAMEKIENGTFTLNIEDEEEDILTAVDTEAATQAAFSQPSFTSGSIGPSASITEKTLDNMSKSELQGELSTAQSDLSDKQSALSAILDGSNSELQALQENIDTAYETYLEQLENVDEDLAKQVDDLNIDINDKEDEIDAKDQEISAQESVVSDAETSYNNAVSTQSTLESSLDALEALDTSEYDSEKLSEYNTKVSELKTKIEEAKTAVSTAEANKNEAQAQLEKLEGEKSTLQEELDDLNEQMTTLEKEISEKYPEVQEYLDAYNTAKEEYAATKEALTTQAKADVQEAQDYVNEVQTAINNYDNKQTTKEYCFGTFGEDISELAESYIGYNESDGSANIFLNGGSSSTTPWCAAFVEYVLENSGEDLPDWYTNCSNKWYCPTIYNAASSADAIIDSSEAQAGDLILFWSSSQGRYGHVGVVTSVNEDGSITTVQGNTSNQVKEITYSSSEAANYTYAKISS